MMKTNFHYKRTSFKSLLFKGFLAGPLFLFAQNKPGNGSLIAFHKLISKLQKLDLFDIMQVQKPAYNRFALSMCFVLMAFNLSALELKKEIKRNYPIGQFEKLYVENKYGNVRLVKSKGKQIEFVVEIRVSSSNSSAARNRIESIVIEFTDLQNELKAKTIFEELNESVFRRWFGSTPEVNTTVNYLIKCPDYLHLYIHNKYGDVYLPDLKGNVDLSLSYGNVQSGNLVGELNADVKYGNIKFVKIGNASIRSDYGKVDLLQAGHISLNLSYGRFHIEEIKNLECNSKYSNVEIGKGGNVIFNGKYDKFKAKNLESFRTQNKYADFAIEMLNREAVFDVAYSKVSLDEFSSDSKKIEIAGKYNSIRIYATHAYFLQMNTRFVSPSIRGNIHYLKNEQESNQRYIEAYKNGRQSNTKVLIDAAYGSVFLE
jgi:hypothetical protein